MSRKKMRSINVILTICLVAEFFCMTIISLGIYARIATDTHNSYSQPLEDKRQVVLSSVTAMKELSEEDILVKNTVPEDIENCHYFLCTLELENKGDTAVEYLTLQAKNQNDDDISCYPINYYQDISEDYEYHFDNGRMVFPEYTSSQYDVILVVEEEQMGEMEELTVFEWGYDESENYVSCIWEDIVTSLPVQ